MMWPSCELADVAFERLEGSGHTTKHEDLMRCLEDAGHALCPPGWPTGEIGFTPISGTLYALGGTPAGTAHAQREVYIGSGSGGYSGGWVTEFFGSVGYSGRPLWVLMRLASSARLSEPAACNREFRYRVWA